MNNAAGTWGGNLNVGAGQNVNITILYQYNDVPDSVVGNTALHTLNNYQVFDNTNSLMSDALISPGGDDYSITYNGANDNFSNAGFFQAGIPNFVLLMGEFGNPGDPLPFGTLFDALVNAIDIVPIARASNFFNDNVNGLNGSRILVGNFVFESRMLGVPEPGTLGLLGAGLIGLAWRRRRA